MVLRRQDYWSEFLSRFNFQIQYRPGKANGKPDGLTRRSGDLFREGDKRLLNQSQPIIKTHNLKIDTTVSNTLGNELTKQHLFEEAIRVDPTLNQVLENLRKGILRHKSLSMDECKDNG